MSNMIYIDCFSGISGDMMAGALLDLEIPGIDIEFFIKELKKIDIQGYRVEAKKQQAGSLYATKFDVFVEGKQPSRSFKEIKELIGNSTIDDNVKKLSIEIFSEIANAEANVHKKPADSVHFHEVGAIDSIIDIVCTSLAIRKIGPEKIYCTHIPLGSGFSQTMHGRIPVPAPATVELLKGLPVYGGKFDFEVTTPTGAAILKVLCDGFCDIPAMIIEKTGNGAGSKAGDGSGKIPNILRLITGKESKKTGEETLAKKLKTCRSGFEQVEKLLIISANLDDFSPEIAGYVLEKFLSEGALDVWIEPIYMKKNRPAFKISVLARYENLNDFIKIAFTETTTLGIRIEEVFRLAIKREIKTVKLPYGEAKIKKGILNDKEITFSPEYDSCAELAKKTGRPLKDIYRDLMLFLSKK